MQKLRLLALAVFILAGCSEPEQQRTYRMGMQNSAPRFDDLDLYIQSLELWSQRADAAIVSVEVPWEELLAGTDPTAYAREHYWDLIRYYWAKEYEIWIYIDPQNGLDRTSDALELQAAGKSIADEDVQLLYREFVVAMNTLFNPDHLGLALETNLIRDIAPESIYQGVRQAAVGAWADIRESDRDVKLSVSVQVEHAWGKLAGGTYIGIEQDFQDFFFISEIGLSSYPYLGFDNPEDIPTNYYRRLMVDHPIHVFFTEGGWSSQSVTTPERSFVSSPEKQAAYIKHHHKLLARANVIGYFQLVFTDIDMEALPAEVPDNIVYFAHLGLVDKELKPKPALKAWDELFKRELNQYK